MITTQMSPTGTTIDLMHRSSADLDVTLLWNRDTGALTLELVDNCSDVIIEFEVPPERASYAFHHPYAFGFERINQARKAQQSATVACAR
jgi:hypothetical protein